MLGDPCRCSKIHADVGRSVKIFENPSGFSNIRTVIRKSGQFFRNLQGSPCSTLAKVQQCASVVEDDPDTRQARVSKPVELRQLLFNCRRLARPAQREAVAGYVVRKALLLFLRAEHLSEFALKIS